MLFLLAVAFAIWQIEHQLDQNRLFYLANIFYLCTIAGALFVFWGEREVNGLFMLFCARSSWAACCYGVLSGAWH